MFGTPPVSGLDSDDSVGEVTVRTPEPDRPFSGWGWVQNGVLV